MRRRRRKVVMFPPMDNRGALLIIRRCSGHAWRTARHWRSPPPVACKRRRQIYVGSRSAVIALIVASQKFTNIMTIEARPTGRDFINIQFLS